MVNYQVVGNSLNTKIIKMYLIVDILKTYETNNGEIKIHSCRDFKGRLSA